MTNPLLVPFNTPHDVPPFEKIENEHFLPALEEAIELAKVEISDIENQEDTPTFYNTIVQLENSGELLGRISHVIFNLNSAETNDELQQVTQKASALLTEFDSEVKQNKALFDRIASIFGQKDSLDLNEEDAILLEKTYKSFVRSGSGLNSEDKKRFTEIQMDLAKLTLTFGENVLAETNDFKLIIDKKEDLSGLPEDVVGRASELAKEDGMEGKWVFTLQAPSYIPFLEYADNRALREKMYRAYMSKAFKGDERDNQDLVSRIVKLRHEKAKLLGYGSYAQFVLEERMAEEPEKVRNFLEEILNKALPAARHEFAEINDLKSELGFDYPLERWDWAYFSEKLRKKKFDLDDEIIKPYFKLEQVIDGAFETAGKLYGLKFEANPNIPTYHPDVMSYEVFDGDELIAVFLADFFPRKGKRPGAWMTSFREQKTIEGERVIPHVSIVCNFTPSSEDSPSLLKFDEVKTLFHEFGHALHGMLAKTNYASLSGTSVFWDFVELPSQIFENWCYEKECLDLFASHYKTGEQFPIELLDRLKASANFQEAYATLRQITFGLLDMSFHHSVAKEKTINVMEIESEIFGKTDLFPRVENTNMSVQFGHIFAGGYAAGYYSYKWAEVLDADAFALFQQNGVFDKATAKSFKENILSQGGTKHPMTLYKQFRGSEPSMDPLLKRAGLLN